MTTLDQLFHKTIDPLPLPRLRAWREELKRPDTKARVEVFAPLAAFAEAPPGITLRISENGSPLSEEEFSWNDELNAGLIRLGVRADDTQQEAIRFSFVLSDALELASCQRGDGFLNHALRYFLEDSDLRHQPEIADALQGMPPAHSPLDERFPPVLEMIADAISGRAHELTGHLGYPEAEAKSILVCAIARYLDDRFSISYRRRMAGA